MKTFVKIIKTFFLVLFILIIGGVVGYAIHYMGYDKIVLAKINPAWVKEEVKPVDNTIVDNTNTVANSVLNQNVVSNDIVDISPNDPKFSEEARDICFQATILHIAQDSRNNNNMNIVVKGMETNSKNYRGNYSFTINGQLPVYYDGLNINSREGSEKIRESGLNISLSAGVNVAIYFNGTVMESSPAQIEGLSKIEILSDFPLEKEIPNLYNITQVTLFNTATSQMAYLEGTDRSDLLLFINNNAFINNAYTIKFPQIMDNGTVYTLSITDNNGVTTRYDIIKYIDTFDPWYAIHKLDPEGRRMNWATEFVNTNQTEFITGILNKFGI